MNTALDINTFFTDPTSIAAVALPHQLFSMLKRSFDVPTDFCALVAEQPSGYTLHKAGSAINGEDILDILFTRTTPLILNLDAGETQSADKYICKASISIRITIIPERSELESFRKAIMGSKRVLTLDAIQIYLLPALQSATQKIAAQFSAADLVAGKNLDQATTTITEALNEPCFAGGLSLSTTPTISFSSEAFDQLRRTEEQAARKLDEHEAQAELQAAIATAQTEKLSHVETMLTRLHQLATNTPSAGITELMQAFDESQRAQLYEALFHSKPRKQSTADVALVSGTQLLFFEPSRLDKPDRTVTISSDAGPLRSVQIASPNGKPTLLIGAAIGIHEMLPKSTTPERTYTAPVQKPTRGGFNSADTNDQYLVAAHSELGLLLWERDKPDSPTSLLPERTAEAKTVRNARFAEEHLWCTIDNRIYRMPIADLQTPPTVIDGSAAVITALCITPEGIFAGNADGRILHWNLQDPGSPATLHLGNRRAAESVSLISSGGIARLFFADTSLAIFARVVGDAFTCRYEAGGQTLRRVEVALDLIAATNDIRDRVILWTPDNPTQPAGIIPVSRITSHTVQDVCLIPFA